MEIVNFNKKDKNLYNNFLLQSRYKDILQSWGWGDVKPKLNWLTHRVGFFEDGKLNGVAQVLEKRLPLGFSLFYVPRGPVVNWSDYKLVSEAISLLSNYVKKRNQHPVFIRIEPPIEKDERVLEIFKTNGFKKYFKTVQPPSTLLVDLSLSEEDLFKSFRRTARNLINRSEKEGVVVEAKEPARITKDDLKGFYNLYKLTGKRFSFSLRPFEQFASLVDGSGEAGKTRFYIAKIKGFILAYGIVLILGDKAFYIWGGTGRHEVYSKFFNYGYIWNILKDLKRIGVKTFDFWGLGPEEDENHPWHGFTVFKKAFSGKRFDYIGGFDLPLSRVYPIFKLIDKIITPKYRAASD